MAEVPRPTGFSVTPHSAPTPLSLDPSGIARGFSEIGGAITNISETLTRHNVYMQQMENKANADQAVTDYIKKQSDALYNPQSGYFTLSDKAAVDAYKPTMDALEQSRQDIASTLNPVAQQLFNQESRRLQSYTMMDAARHAATERKNWLTDTSNGLKSQYANSAALNYKSDDAFNTALAGIQNEDAHQGALFNKPKEAVDAQIAKDTSSLWSARISRLADDSPRDALQMFKDNFDKLDAVDSVRLGRSLKSYTQASNISTIVGGIVNGQPTGDFKSLWSAQTQQESGGKQSASNDIHGGHFGVAQLSPETARIVALQHGIPFDLNRLKTDKEYNDGLGQLYMQEQLQNYGGNAAVALAAYNAGPGTVNTWLKRFGDPTKGEIPTQAFIDRIPYPETKNYVNVILGKSGMTATPPTSEDPKSHLTDWLHQADQVAGDDLDMRNKLEAGVVSHVNRLETAFRGQRNDALNSLLTTVNGGEFGKDPKPTSIDQLLNSDAAKASWKMLDAKGQQTLLNDLTKNAKGPAITVTPEALDRYSELYGMAKTDPTRFQSIDLAHESELPVTYRKRLLEMQQKPDVLNPNLMHALSVANTVPGTPPKMVGDSGDKSFNPDYDKFTGRLLDEIQTFEAVHSRNPNDADVRKMSANLLLNVKNPDGSWTPGFQHALKLPVPLADKQAIVRAFMKINQRAPSGMEISDIFRAHKQQRAAPPATPQADILNSSGSGM